MTAKLVDGFIYMRTQTVRPNKREIERSVMEKRYNERWKKSKTWKSFINVYSLDFCYVKHNVWYKGYAFRDLPHTHHTYTKRDGVRQQKKHTRDEIGEYMYKHGIFKRKNERTFPTGNQTIRVEAISFPNFPFVLIFVSNWYTQANHIFATATKTRPNLFASITWTTCAHSLACALIDTFTGL